ncbi:MAG: AMP-binding protein [Cryobacterium sp.]|uniref:AMP-binding protein n=1 Tax=unclassified Cryobacterium TaxID=2649013 RepID=UPI001A2CCF77|nr:MULTISPECIES: AMP-binding protein [unclassified Cryobacterium]MCY7403745.1 AMP-binding protein [Cryobacterium sp.]MEC5154145.1 acyl-CoA synthetase (AMP-forming)/AMP-acid ligase II [Cryobacterium sp. CAN_C3]
MRPLRVLVPGHPLDFLAAVRDALAGSGPALLPVLAGAAEPLVGDVPKRVAVVIETSGSAGVPKRVMLATNALLAGAAASTVALGGAGQWLLALPVHYIAGVQVLVRSIAAETSPLVLPPGHFDPQNFRRLAETMTEPLRYTALVPVQLARLIDAADDPALLAVLRRFTAILVGGQAIRGELIARAEALNVRVVRTYGSSETAGGCVYNGVPIGDTLVRVVDGQLELSGSVLAEGYLDDEARTADRFLVEHGVRWYRTGDLGEVDPHSGRVTVLGRADNVIISGGEKVSLDAVEDIVRSHPGFEQAVVIGGDDEKWGKVPVVVVAGGEGAEVDLMASIVAMLGRAARPARVVRVAEIPLLTSGKPDRAALASNMGAWHKELGRPGPNNND